MGRGPLGAAIFLFTFWTASFDTGAAPFGGGGVFFIFYIRIRKSLNILFFKNNSKEIKSI